MVSEIELPRGPFEYFTLRGLTDSGTIYAVGFTTAGTIRYYVRELGASRWARSANRIIAAKGNAVLGYDSQANFRKSQYYLELPGGKVALGNSAAIGLRPLGVSASGVVHGRGRAQFEVNGSVVSRLSPKLRLISGEVSLVNSGTAPYYLLVQDVNDHAVTIGRARIGTQKSPQAFVADSSHGARALVGLVAWDELPVYGIGGMKLGGIANDGRIFGSRSFHEKGVGRAIRPFVLTPIP